MHHLVTLDYRQLYSRKTQLFHLVLKIQVCSLEPVGRKLRCWVRLPEAVRWST